MAIEAQDVYSPIKCASKEVEGVEAQLKLKN